MRPLSDLLSHAQVDARWHGNASVAISGLAVDSRAVKPGDLFFALPGTRTDGAAYIAQAIRQGAAAVAASALPEGGCAVPLAQIADLRAAVSRIAAVWYQRQPAHMLAVTGTDGKTSTAEFTRQLAQLSGRDAASIGTLGQRSAHVLADVFPANNTSPEPLLLHRTLDALAQAGVDICAMEASSHGLDQKRLEGVHLQAASFTNFGRDHLDYHVTQEAYFAAKSRLFGELLPAAGTAVLNADDDAVMRLRDLCQSRGHNVITFGYAQAADLQLQSVVPTPAGLQATLKIAAQQFSLDLPVYGEFQLRNMLAAIGLLSACGLHAEALVGHLPALHGVPGRLERIAQLRGASVFIDYAHTPEALSKILRVLRAHTQGRLHVVFGCGGERDPGKRPLMGAAAAQLADRVTVTDDNPRGEDAAAIRRSVLAAAPGAEEIANRRDAIAAALRALTPGDVLVVAGKGHETSQIIGTQTLPFNDADCIREEIAA